MPGVRDISSGLPADRESVVQAAPTVPYWAENMMFALYDPEADLGFWLHLGTVPTDWSMWEDRALAYLPNDGGVLHTVSYGRTPPEGRPAGPNLSFRCVEPFVRWKLSLDARCLLSGYEELRTGRAKDGLRYPLSFDLDVEHTVPAWDAHASATSDHGKGSMRGQSWATEHYQQLYRVTGTVRLPDREVAFNGTGWRDHSRGPRHGGTGAAWGGHAIVSALFPESNRAFGVSRMWAPDGVTTLDAGFVVTEDGTLHHAEVIEAPRLWDFQRSGEEVKVTLKSAAGVAEISGTTVTSLWMTRNHGLAYGIEMEGEPSILAESFARFEWDGETSYGLCERSEHPKDPPKTIRAPGA